MLHGCVSRCNKAFSALHYVLSILQLIFKRSLDHIAAVEIGELKSVLSVQFPSFDLLHGYLLELLRMNLSIIQSTSCSQ